MATVPRDRIQVIHDNDIPTGNNIQQSPVVPAGQKWEITRIVMADKGIGDHLSGAFQVDFGSEVIAAAYLTGNTMSLQIDRAFEGDGVKRFRYIRQNNSASTKGMFLMVEGFKRIGDL